MPIDLRTHLLSLAERRLAGSYLFGLHSAAWPIQFGGTMGVGMGFAIAAAAVHPDKKVVAVEGDSAFGFSGMEVEVACRYRLPITFIIVNNNGIGGGPTELDPNARPPVSALSHS